MTHRIVDGSAPMSNYIETNYISWSQAHFNLMADGGTWAIPRTGLVYRREGEALALVSRMPWHESMGITAERLRKWQDDEISAIRLNFEKAGISVVYRTNG